MRRTDTPESDDTDKESVVAKIALGAPPCDIAVSPDSDDVDVATVDSLIVVNGFHYIVARIPVGYEPKWISLSADGIRLYVAHYDTDAISNIDLTTRVVISSPLDDAPIALVVAPDHHRLYATGLQSVAVVDIETNVTETIAVGGLPRHLHFVGHENTAYIADFSNRKVAELDTVNNTIQANIDVGWHPDERALGGERLYVADYLADTISVISMAAVTRESKDT